jgi:hypothetical protein
MLFINLIFGLLGGVLFGSIGVVVAYGLTFTYGGAVALKLWLDHENMSMLRFFRDNTSASAGIAIPLSFSLLFVFEKLNDVGHLKQAVVLSVASSLIAGAMILSYLYAIRHSFGRTGV